MNNKLDKLFEKLHKTIEPLAEEKREAIQDMLSDIENEIEYYADDRGETVRDEIYTKADDLKDEINELKEEIDNLEHEAKEYKFTAENLLDEQKLEILGKIYKHSTLDEIAELERSLNLVNKY